jgi:hypothetical protein
MDLNPSRITANPEDPSSDLLTSCEQARDEIAIAVNCRAEPASLGQ